MKVTQLIICNYRVVSALGGKEFVISEYLRPNPSNNHGNIILKIEDNEDNYVVSLFKKPSVADAQKLLEEEIIKDMSSQFSNLSSGPSDPSQPSNQGCLSSQCDLEDATAALQQYEINPRPPLHGSPIISATQLQLEEDNILPVSQCVLGEKRSPLLCQAFPPPLPDINDRGDGSCVSVVVMTICGDDVPTGQEGRVPGLDIGVSGLVGGWLGDSEPGGAAWQPEGLARQPGGPDGPAGGPGRGHGGVGFNLFKHSSHINISAPTISGGSGGFSFLLRPPAKDPIAARY